MNGEVRGELEQLPRFRLYDTMLEQDKGDLINSIHSLKPSLKLLREH